MGKSRDEQEQKGLPTHCWRDQVRIECLLEPRGWIHQVEARTIICQTHGSWCHTEDAAQGREHARTMTSLSTLP